MKTKLSESEKADLVKNIQTVIDTDAPWENKSLHHPAGAIIDAVLSIPGMAKKETETGNGEGFESNGWAWDWWQKLTHNGKEYTLRGSGYYGGHGFNLSDSDE